MRGGDFVFLPQLAHLRHQFVRGGDRPDGAPIERDSQQRLFGIENANVADHAMMSFGHQLNARRLERLIDHQVFHPPMADGREMPRPRHGATIAICRRPRSPRCARSPASLCLRCDNLDRAVANRRVCRQPHAVTTRGACREQRAAVQVQLDPLGHEQRRESTFRRRSASDARSK